MSGLIEKLANQVVRKGICTGCGACVALCQDRNSRMEPQANGPVPVFAAGESLADEATCFCPGLGIHYPELYRSHYHTLPDNWLIGPLRQARTGYSAAPSIRRAASSGGVITQTLLYLLETKRIDGAILARQGVPSPLEAQAVLCYTRDEILACSQSVYIPVSMLDILRDLPPGKVYAITCLPEQSAALRILQQNGFAPANQVKYVLGPYTGTALVPAAIPFYLRANRVSKDDAVVSLKWRAGEWPGYLEIRTRQGRVLKSPKIYYNFMIPFFVTQTSLQSMDFANEFADLSVGDAWSPAFERAGGGHSVFVTRSEGMEQIIKSMCDEGILAAESVDPRAASDMHGHMIDFKKRGGYIRNRWRRAVGLSAPDYGMRPRHIPASRYAVEIVVSSLFLIGRSPPARLLLGLIPERFIGPVFNFMRLQWKALSKPTKRKGLKNFTMELVDHA